jgi:hypothetical protein
MFLESAILHFFFVSIQLAMPRGQRIAVAQQWTIENHDAWMREILNAAFIKARTPFPFARRLIPSMRISCVLSSKETVGRRENFQA